MTLFHKARATALLSLLGLAAAPAAHAQINININTAPPVVVGAPVNAQYYYVPEIGGYYDVPAQVYIVPEKGKWKRVKYLKGYNSAYFHPQYIEYRGDSPWTYRGGNPHGLPPGQAKKLYRDGYRDGRDDRYDDDDRGHGHGHGHGRD